MNFSEIMQLLRAHFPELQEKFGLKGLSLFGSVARGDATIGSDLDVLVEFERSPTFDQYMDTKFYLEDLTGMPVDLVTKGALKSRIRLSVEQESVRVA